MRTGDYDVKVGKGDFMDEIPQCSYIGKQDPREKKSRRCAGNQNGTGMKRRY